ncbi:O-antigen ligase family protein [Alkalitalea saponilacus]|nr:O-antigen ligase family protein [Alkalitalea saponilacus]
MGIFWGVSLICFLQACYGLVQLLGWLPSNHISFPITGSFDNPAGFAAVLSLGFPIGLYLFSKAKGIEKNLASTILAIISVAVILSGSRTGIIAIVISSGIFVAFNNIVLSKFRKLHYHKLLSGLILICLAIGFFTLYHQKKDSANGRLLIWKVSSEMIKDKPVFGHGYGTFQAIYMDYQAEYFRNNPNSKFELLADNVKHPFNEFLKVAVEYGLVGLIIVFSFLFFFIWKTVKLGGRNKRLVLSGLLTFIVFAFFSYPLHYIPVWLLIGFYISFLIPSKEFKIRNTPISILSRSVFFIGCLFTLLYVYQQLRLEMKWKTIAINSLQGNTLEMLPEYERLYSTMLKKNPLFLYNFGAELHVAEEFDRSIEILEECKRMFNDYDLQILLAENCYQTGDYQKSIEMYEHASFMIPCRFIPLYKQFEIYKEKNNETDALRLAFKINEKSVKIKSSTVSYIQFKAETYINENKGKSIKP